jgi:hypothetical protein
MATEWERVPSAVVKLAEELIYEHHPNLLSARIGILFRSEAPVSGGKRTLGQASTVNAKWKPLLREEYDFIIWLAADAWLGELTDHQRRALLDHELYHCHLNNEDKAEIRPHDIEEFAEIIQRYGFWRDDLERVRLAVQGRLALANDGYVKAIFPELKEQMERAFDDVEVSLAYG